MLNAQPRIKSSSAIALGRMEARIALKKLLAHTRESNLEEANQEPPGQRSYNFAPTDTFRSLADLHTTPTAT